MAAVSGPDRAEAPAITTRPAAGASDQSSTQPTADAPWPVLGCDRIVLPRSSGVQMPAIGLGTWLAKDDDCYNAVLLGLRRAGLRHVDTASVYRNEEVIGKAIRDSKIPRDEIFLTSKLHPADAGDPAKVVAACKASIARLGVEHLDLFLVHWPGISGKDPGWKGHGKARELTWQGMQRVLKDGLARAIGVSNWLPQHLDELARGTHSEDGKGPDVMPMVNQFELHPLLQQRDIQEACRKHDILVQPYCPLARADDRLFKNESFLGICKKHSRTPAQVAIRWALQHGWPSIPKSVTPSRILENCSPGILTFELSAEDMAAIDGMQITPVAVDKGETGAPSKETADPDDKEKQETGRLCWDPTVVA